MLLALKSEKKKYSQENENKGGANHRKLIAMKIVKDLDFPTA